MRESRTGTWFQSPEAFDFFSSMPEWFIPFCIGVEESEPRAVSRESGEIRGVCVGYVTRERSRVKQFFTRRAIITGGPCLADDATGEEVRLLLEGVKQITNGRMIEAPIYIETRNFEDYSPWKEAFTAAGFTYKRHLNFHVNPADYTLSDNRKRQIRKAESVSVKVERDDAVSEQDVQEWYRILERLYKKKVKTPLWPEKFFMEAYRQGAGKFMMVKHEGKVIGGSMIVVKNGTVYEWFECGMNSEYKELYPSVMATNAGIQWAKEHGYTRYDMMGAGEPDVPYGVRDFKAEFGGQLVEHGRWMYICNTVLYSIGLAGVKLLKMS